MAARRNGRMPPRPARRASVVVGSARRVRPAAREFQRQRLPWQERCWSYYNEIGEIKYAGAFYARILSKIEFYPAVRSADGRSILRVVTPEVVGVLERIQDATGTRARLQARYGVQRFVVGESYLTCTFGRDDGGVVTEEWEMLSSSELTIQGDGTYLRDAGNGTERKRYSEPAENSNGAPGEMMVWRLWNSHAEHSNDPDSPLRGVMEPCDRLLTLGRAIQARGRSRIAGAGIMLLAQELTVAGRPAEVDPAMGSDPDDGPAGDATDDQTEDPVAAAIHEAMVQSIKHEGDASSVVPVTLTIPSDMLDDAVRHITFWDANGYPEADQVEQELRRIALGLDMPAETLLGMADMNHWSAWVVSREAYASHGQPVVEELAADLTSAYFRPAVDQLGMTTVDVDAQGEVKSQPVAPGEVFIWYDDSAVVLNPDRAKDSKDAHDRFVISDQALRKELGFDPTDAPDDAEYQRRVERGKQQAAPGGGGDGSQPSDVQPGEPSTSPDAGNASRLAGIAEAALVRLVEAAGARLRTRLAANPDYQQAYKKVPNGALCATAGRDIVRSLFGPNERVLVSGAVDQLVRRRFNGTADALIDELERIAAASLYDDGEPVLSRKALRLVVLEARGDAR